MTKDREVNRFLLLLLHPVCAVFQCMRNTNKIANNNSKMVL